MENKAAKGQNLFDECLTRVASNLTFRLGASAMNIFNCDFDEYVFGVIENYKHYHDVINLKPDHVRLQLRIAIIRAVGELAEKLNKPFCAEEEIEELFKGIRQAEHDALPYYEKL